MAESEEMLHLCQRVRDYLAQENYKKCVQEICYAMYLHPSAPEPHNLMGILLERQRNHAQAMKHFRAAQDLDPTYRPAMENMMDYARFDRPRPRNRFTCADCDEQDESTGKP